MLRDQLPRPRGLQLRCAGVLLLLALGLVQADRLTDIAEEGLYSDPIVYSHQSPFQRIAVTHGRTSFQLFLDGNLQFSSADEYRYPDALVHPTLAAPHRRGRLLVLGGGDGLALRAILTNP